MTKDNINGFWNVDFSFFKQTYFLPNFGNL